MQIARLLSCILFICIFIRLAVKSTNPLPVSENYMVLFCFALFSIALLYAIASDALAYKKKLPHSNRMATIIISSGYILATLFVIIKKDALSQPTLLKVTHSGDSNESYTIDFKTNDIYVYESRYFTKNYNDGIYRIEGDTITLIDSLPGIPAEFSIAETKTGNYLLPIQKKEEASVADNLQITEDNRKK